MSTIVQEFFFSRGFHRELVYHLTLKKLDRERKLAPIVVKIGKHKIKLIKTINLRDKKRKAILIEKILTNPEVLAQLAKYRNC